MIHHVHKLLRSNTDHTQEQDSLILWLQARCRGGGGGAIALPLWFAPIFFVSFLLVSSVTYSDDDNTP